LRLPSRQGTTKFPGPSPSTRDRRHQGDGALLIRGRLGQRTLVLLASKRRQAWTVRAGPFAGRRPDNDTHSTSSRCEARTSETGRRGRVLDDGDVRSLVGGGFGPVLVRRAFLPAAGINSKSISPWPRRFQRACRQSRSGRRSPETHRPGFVSSSTSMPRACAIRVSGFDFSRSMMSPVGG